MYLIFLVPKILMAVMYNSFSSMSVTTFRPGGTTIFGLYRYVPLWFFRKLTSWLKILRYKVLF